MRRRRRRQFPVKGLPVSGETATQRLAILAVPLKTAAAANFNKQTLTLQWAIMQIGHIHTQAGKIGKNLRSKKRFNSNLQ